MFAVAQRSAFRLPLPLWHALQADDRVQDRSVHHASRTFSSHCPAPQRPVVTFVNAQMHMQGLLCHSRCDPDHGARQGGHRRLEAGLAPHLPAGQGTASTLMQQSWYFEFLSFTWAAHSVWLPRICVRPDPALVSCVRRPGTGSSLVARKSNPGKIWRAGTAAAQCAPMPRRAFCRRTLTWRIPQHRAAVRTWAP